MSCCSKIMDVLKKVLKAIGPILAIALIVFAAYLLIFAESALAFIVAMEGFLALPAVLVGLEATTWAYIAIGLAVVVSPSTVTSIASSAGKFVGKTVSNIAGAVIAGTVGALVGASSGGLGQTVILAGCAYLAYLFLTSQKEDKDKKAASDLLDRQLRLQEAGLQSVRPNPMSGPTQGPTPFLVGGAK